jgi:hypothetical protein
MSRKGSSTAPELRFWSKVNREGPIPIHFPELGPCWVWTGKIHRQCGGRKDYGVIWTNGKELFTHRLSYSMHFGKIPEGQSVLHHCDNPPCVRPSHLYLGTQKDNVRDMMTRSRGKSHLSQEAIREIRERYAAEEITQEALGRQYGASQVTVSQIILRKVFKHL